MSRGLNKPAAASSSQTTPSSAASAAASAPVEEGLYVVTSRNRALAGGTSCPACYTGKRGCAKHPGCAFVIAEVSRRAKARFAAMGFGAIAKASGSSD